MKRVVLLWSGGIDSTLCLVRLLFGVEPCEVWPIFFDYGHLGRNSEMLRIYMLTEWLRENRPACLERFHPLTISEMTMPNHYLTGGASEEYAKGYTPDCVPARNTVFAMLGYYYARRAQATEVHIAVHGPANPKHKPFPDCTQDWVDQVNGLYSLENLTCRSDSDHIELVAPLINMRKSAIVRAFRRRGMPETLTWACYFPQGGGGEPCGECKACKSRMAGGLKW